MNKINTMKVLLAIFFMIFGLSCLGAQNGYCSKEEEIEKTLIPLVQKDFDKAFIGANLQAGIATITSIKIDLMDNKEKHYVGKILFDFKPIPGYFEGDRAKNYEVGIDVFLKDNGYFIYKYDLVELASLISGYSNQILQAAINEQHKE